MPIDEPVVRLKKTADDTILGDDLRPITYSQSRWIIALLLAIIVTLLFINMRINWIWDRIDKAKIVYEDRA